MGRIRTIKPEFPHSESMGRVSRDARLTFIQLWTLSDDAGRLRGNSRMLASLLFPYDDDAKELIDGWLNELEKENCIRRYLIEGTSYLEICNWLRHQKIDKPTPSKLPRFEKSSRLPANPREESSGDLDLDLDLDQEGIKEGNGSTPASATPTLLPHVAKVSGMTTDPEWLLDFKLVYPDRAGDQKWRAALKAGNARMAEGHSANELIEGAKRYDAYCKATGKVGTEFVKQASTFLGPDKSFLLPWNLPATKADTRFNANISAMQEFMRRTEGQP
jgi:hypothetical protein